MNKTYAKIATFGTSAILSIALTACTDSTSANEELFASISSSSEENTPNSSDNSKKAKSSSSEKSKTDKSKSSSSTISSSTSNKTNSSSSTPISSETLQSSSSSIESSSSEEPKGLVTPTGSFTDSRDGKTYKLTNIGGQIWMAEDLNYGDSSMYAYKDAESACPEGFHLPTIDEFKELVAFAGGEEVAAKKLKSKTGWPSDSSGDWNGTDDYGFNAKPFKSGDGTGTDENFWTSTRDFGNYRTINMMKLDPHPTSTFEATDIIDGNGRHDVTQFCKSKNDASPSRACFINAEPATRIAIRCLSNLLDCNGIGFDYAKQFCQDGTIYDLCYGHPYDGKKYKCENNTIIDRSTDSVYKPSWRNLNPDIKYGLFQDSRDGQYYKTVDIDGVVWFAENLNYASEGSLCFEDSLFYCDFYGRLYTQKQAIGNLDSIPKDKIQGLCPPGSHLSTYEEYKHIFDTYDFTADLFSSYKENDYSNYYKFDNKKGFSLVFSGTYTANPPSSYVLKWDGLNFDIHLFGSNYSHDFSRDWIRRNFYENRGPSDDKVYGNVRCVVD